MVTKTEQCVYSEYKIWPGRGKKFAGRDGKVHYFISKKCAALFHKKTKPVKLTWTQAWRRFNKKVKQDDVTKRRTRKTTRVQRAIVGLSLEDIKRRRNEKPEDRKAKMEAAQKEIRDRKKKEIEKKKAEKKAQQKVAAPVKQAQPKNAAAKKAGGKGKGK